MLSSSFYFHDELNDFLPPHKREKPITLHFNSDQSAKHLIESLGIPHTEIGMILVNGRRMDLNTLLHEGDMVDVYPPAQNQAGGWNHMAHRFVLDNHLGQLATYLRMLGFDALYRNDYQDEELARISSQENRTLLTRDRRLLMRNLVQNGYWVRSKIPRQQLVEVLRRFQISDQVTPFKRCLRCNGLLRPVSKEAVLHRLEPLTKKYFDEFRICPECEQVYWQGSHYGRMVGFIEQVIAECQRD